MTSADPSALLDSDDAIVVSAVALTPVRVMLESDLEASDSSHDWKNGCGASQAVAGRRLRMDQLAFRKLLAHGAGGSEVWTAKYYGSRVAVKRRPALSAAATEAAAGGSLKPSRPGAAAATPTATAPPKIDAELELLVSLHHRNIVRFYGVAWNSPDSLCIVTEYARKGSLEEYLRPRQHPRQRGSSDGERLTWMQAKLIGVGGPTAAATSWPRSLEDDICALGVLFAELIAHCEHAAESGARASFVHEEHKTECESLPPPPVCTLEIREIVGRCMAADPSVRPRIGDVYGTTMQVGTNREQQQTRDRPPTKMK
ncbi:hypothetical protein PybrP1_006318 [[Pythium] brassicae (nom. inval.)]|nr:hypothetical protein PybrP1_006318 [[Pythium] brassicae (nom. inval.)]